jgi:hypothetical protein
MQYHQEKFNSGKKLNSIADISLEIEGDSIIYRGTFFMEFKKNESPDGVTFKHELYINRVNGDFIITYEIQNKRSAKGRLRSNSWVKKTDFDKLNNLTHMGFYRGEKRRGFWGVKFERKTSEFFDLIKKELQSEMDSEFLKNKTYYKPVSNRLFDLIVDYHLYKRGIKGHDNVYQDILSAFPKKKWLKLNDNKFLPAILDENGVKSKYMVKELSKREHPTHIHDGTGVNIRGVMYLCNLFGENHLDYIKRFEWKEIARTPFNKRKKHECKTEGEKRALVDIFNKHIALDNAYSVRVATDPPRVRNMLLSLHNLIEVRNLLEERGYVLKLKLKTPDDVELLLPYWSVIKKGALSGFVMKYKIPQEVIDDIQTPIMRSDKTFQPRVLLTDSDFSLEGLEMKNCMAKQFMHGAIFIYISLSYEKTKVDLQYQRGKLHQSYGKANSPVPMELFGEALRELNERMSKYHELKWEKEKLPLPPKPF